VGVKDRGQGWRLGPRTTAGSGWLSGVTAVDKDPESYVGDIEEEIAVFNDQGNNGTGKSAGSLGIGSLKRR
jgi:hypothetical protein